jgi:hypothetical protein
MNNGVLTKIIASLATSGIIAIATALWSFNSRLATLDERITNVLVRSDHNDAEMSRQLAEIKEQLRSLRK